QLEGPRVDAHDVVHRVMLVEREHRPRVDAELVAAEDGWPSHQLAHVVIPAAHPAGAPEPQGIAAQGAHEALAIRKAAAHDRRALPAPAGRRRARWARP